MDKRTAKVKKFVSVLLSVITIYASCPYAAEQAVEEVKLSTAAPAAAPAPRTQDNKQLLSAISDLNYKIEYLQTNYNRLNVDIEALRAADRDQKKLFNDRISALPMPDMSRIENLETESALMRSEMAQIRADIAQIKGRSDYKTRVAADEDSKTRILRSPWIAVAALGIALIALIKK